MNELELIQTYDGAHVTIRFDEITHDEAREMLEFLREYFIQKENKHLDYDIS